MVTVIEPDQSRANAFRKFGSDFAQGQKNRSDEMALKKAIEGLGANPNPRDLLNAITRTSTYSNEGKQQLLKNLMGVAEFEEAQRKAKKHEELQQQTTNFQKGLAKEHVKQYVDAEKAIVQSGRNLQDLDRLTELNNKLSGPLGYFSALNPFNEDASELKALGFGAIEPIVKTFNPSGPIAQKKLEQLQKIYGINLTDSSAQVKGKIAALRRYANYAKDIAEQRIELFKKYDGNPPLGEVAQLDVYAGKVLDNMTAEDPTKPQIFYSTKDGRPVKAPSLEQQEKWLNEGIITDVKPR